MEKTPKNILLNNIDDLDLYFMEGENELEFDIDDYSFIITYSPEPSDIFVEDYESIKGENKLEILSINATNNEKNEDFNVDVDDELQKLFSDYYNNTLTDANFEPLSVNFGEFSDFMD